MLKEIFAIVLIVIGSVMIVLALFYLLVMTIVMLKVRKESRRPALVGGIIGAVFGAGISILTGIPIVIAAFTVGLGFAGVYFGALWGICNAPEEAEEE